MAIGDRSSLRMAAERLSIRVENVEYLSTLMGPG
jgi:hypothetical protein